MQSPYSKFNEASRPVTYDWPKILTLVLAVFIALGIITKAFVLQAFHMHYTLREWAAFDHPLCIPAELEFLSATQLPVDAHPPMRGEFARAEFWPRLAQLLDTIGGPRSTPDGRATAYRELTGVPVPPIAWSMQTTAMRIELQHV